MATEHNSNLVQIKPAKSAGETVPVTTELSLEQARETLSSAKGPRYWRSLEELSNTAGFDAMIEKEFPRQAGELMDPVSRRGFLKLSAASLALAGLSACTKQPSEPIIPYVQQPEDLIPGKPMYFATARPTAFGAHPLLVKSHMYRPIKVDGNPEHPMSLGASDIFSQASILDLYDPDRSQTLTHNAQMRTWGEFATSLREALAAEKTSGGAGIRVLSETVVSPTLMAQVQAAQKAFPKMQWVQYDPVSRDTARTGLKMAFGGYYDANYHLEEADVIVSLDADFLGSGYFPGHLKLTREFAKKRKLELDGGKREMNRLYVVESQMSATGAKADHRQPLRFEEVERFAHSLWERMQNKSADYVKANNVLDAMAKDLAAAKGRCVVIAGVQQSPFVHAMAAQINQFLGNVGKTVTYIQPIEFNANEQVPQLKQLVDDMKGGKVNVLLILGGNPVYNAPADFEFEKALTAKNEKGSLVKFTAHLSPYKDETTQFCEWHVPSAHYLESWSDAKTYDGSVCLMQPLIEPLYGGKSAHEVMAQFTDTPGATSYEIVRDYWKTQAKSADFEAWWRKSLHDGFVPNSAHSAQNVSSKSITYNNPPDAEKLELVFRPDPTVHDGRYNNNGWLQELPKPIHKLTWDNAILMSQKTSRIFGKKTTSEDTYKDKNTGTETKESNTYSSPLRDGDIVELTVGAKKIKAPVVMVPGHPDNSLTVTFGYGRTQTGRVGTDAGFDVYQLRTSTMMSSTDAGVNLTFMDGEHTTLAITQHHHLIDGEKHIFGQSEQGEAGESEAGIAAEKRNLIISGTLEQYEKNDIEALKEEKSGLSLYPEWTKDPGIVPADSHKWGMAIDMNSCTGCNACVLACVSENNISVVGKEQVTKGRIMHWIRLDTYFESHSDGDVSNPRAHFQPMPCQQCENAPCEPVCPVGATVHSPEGLNAMVYNRCVGTRYCSNNCPYKVRRFNFLLFSDFETESLKPMRNPDVSVRSRGVMEKCTYCVQRITASRIAAEKEDRKVRDGEVVTACQQSCPADAIVFGDLNDAQSRVSKWAKSGRNYTLLNDVNTRPRTSYLAAITNPNPALHNTKKEAGKKAEG